MLTFYLKDGLASLLCFFPPLVPNQPPPVECVPLQLGWLAIKDKDWLDLVEQQLAHTVVESDLKKSQTDEEEKLHPEQYQVSMGHSMSRLVPHSSHSLVQPDGNVHCQNLQTDTCLT